VTVRDLSFGATPVIGSHDITPFCVYQYCHRNWKYACSQRYLV